MSKEIRVRKTKRNRKGDLLCLCCQRVTENVYTIIFIRAITLRAMQDKGWRGELGGGDSATFIIKSRLLAFTPPRNGKIQDLRTIAPLLTVCVARNAHL